jgi:hypothetical protein
MVLWGLFAGLFIAVLVVIGETDRELMIVGVICGLIAGFMMGILFGALVGAIVGSVTLQTFPGTMAWAFVGAISSVLLFGFLGAFDRSPHTGAEFWVVLAVFLFGGGVLGAGAYVLLADFLHPRNQPSDPPPGPP